MEELVNIEKRFVLNKTFLFDTSYSTILHSHIVYINLLYPNLNDLYSSGPGDKVRTTSSYSLVESKKYYLHLSVSDSVYTSKNWGVYLDTVPGSPDSTLLYTSLHLQMY